MLMWVQIPLEVLWQLLKGVEKHRLTRLFKQSVNASLVQWIEQDTSNV